MSKGLALLAELDKAELKRDAARHLRAVASQYGAEYEGASKNCETAGRLEKEADYITRNVGRRK